VEAHLTGAFPRSEQLVEATRAAERGKISKAEVDAILDHDVTALVEIQQRANLDSYVDGQLNWQDLFRPFSELFTGIRLGSLTRWFDNNTFYREPVIVDRITVGAPELQPFFRYALMPSQARKKAILPGPFTFAVLSHNSAYPSLADLIDDIAHALKRTTENLGRSGYSSVQFNEPALGVNGRTKEDFELAKHALEICA
jgi:5-methyltetrahydropteroyltriglutamate--homocysteine methyltransferase